MSALLPISLWRPQLVVRQSPLGRPCRSSSSDANAVVSSPSFEQQYDELASILAPGGTVRAAPTPLGRGLVIVPERGCGAGSTLLSVDWANLLVVADEPLASGDGGFARRVLQDFQLLHGHLPPLLVRYLLGDEGDWFSRLAAWLLWLKHAPMAGPWRRYVVLLPQEAEMTCLMNYGGPGRDADLAELQVGSLMAAARRERRQIADLHDRLFGAGGELRALGLAPGGVQDTVWAACMVNSRAFSERVEGEAVSLLVPCADMANHSALAPNAAYQYCAADDAFQLRALQDMGPGVEAVISYGCTQKDNEGLMRDYGFVVPGCLNDRVPLASAAAPAGDDVASRLLAATAATPEAAALGRGGPSLSTPRLLAALGLLDGSSSTGSGSSFDLGAAAATVMGDTDEDAWARRRLAAVLSLQPFLRDTGAAAATSAAAPPPPLDDAGLQRERASAAALERQCAALLAGLPTSAATDEALLEADSVVVAAMKKDGSSSSSEGAAAVLGVRRRQAVVARLEHKRVVAAARDALQRYGAALR